MTIPRFQMPEARLRARHHDDAARARILSPGHLVILSSMGAAQSQGTQYGPHRRNSVVYAPRPACLARRRAALEGRSQAVVRLGGIR